jgi:RNA polymerase sigma-70 factor (ECF subfamily)
MDKIRDARTLHYWIIRIVTNVFYERGRRTRRCPTISLDACVASTGDKLLIDECSTCISMEAHAEAVERMGMLNKGIQALPARQRILISLYHLQDRSCQQIAADLQIPIGTVKSRLSRPRMGLRMKLEPERAMLTT